MRARAGLLVVGLATAAMACTSCGKKIWPGPGANDERSSPSTKAAPSTTARGELDPKAPETAGPHPRILLTPERLSAVAKLKASHAPAWERLAEQCDQLVTETAPAGYEAWDWANGAMALALCHRVTGDKKAAAAAVKYFVALLDDREKVGDGKGGDRVVEHDDGYPIRVRGGMGAILYDWLDGFPGMTPELKKHAVDRFVVWSKWFEQKGWNHEEPISNYYTGWFATAAFGAIAASGEDPRAADLRALSAKLWNEGIVPAYTAKLAGGDFPEGWQYGDNVLAFLAFFCDAERSAHLEKQLPWLRETVLYHQHALTPDLVHTYDTGDWEEHPPKAQLHGVESLAMLLGGDDADGRRAAMLTALARKSLDESEEWRWFAALAAGVAKPNDELLKKSSTSYLARGTATMLARNDWSPSSVWVAFSSAPTLSDHQHLDAGHFEIVRGGDWLVVDSGDYAAFSSMSHNTILVDDAREVMAYTPNQGTWSDSAKLARFDDDGTVVHAMADYASAYKGISGKSAVSRAERELVYVRGPNETAEVVVYDRLTLRKPAYGATFLLHGGKAPQMSGARATIKVGGSAAFVTTLLPAGASPRLVHEPTPPARDRPFYNNEPPEGVKATRIEVTSPKGSEERRFLSTIVVGPAGDAAPAAAAAAAELVKGSGVEGARLGDDAFVFVADAPQSSAAPVSFTAAAKRAIVVGLAPSQGYSVSAKKNGDACDVALAPGGGRSATAGGTLTIALDASCAPAK